MHQNQGIATGWGKGRKILLFGCLIIWSFHAKPWQAPTRSTWYSFLVGKVDSNFDSWELCCHSKVGVFLHFRNLVRHFSQQLHRDYWHNHVLRGSHGDTTFLLSSQTKAGGSNFASGVGSNFYWVTPNIHHWTQLIKIETNSVFKGLLSLSTAMARVSLWDLKWLGQGLPWCPVVNTLCCQCKGCGFYTWSVK